MSITSEHTVNSPQRDDNAIPNSLSLGTIPHSDGRTLRRVCCIVLRLCEYGGRTQPRRFAETLISECFEAVGECLSSVALCQYPKRDEMVWSTPCVRLTRANGARPQGYGEVNARTLQTHAAPTPPPPL
ncbi:hypothetical protein CBL_12407 [Carabus blaptoides fortunei]